MAENLVQLAETFVRLTGELNATRDAMRRALMNGSAPPEAKPNPTHAKRPGGIGSQPKAKPTKSAKAHPNARMAAEAEAKIIALLRSTPGMRPVEIARQMAARPNHRAALGEDAGARRGSARRSGGLRRVRLSAEEIADLTSPAPVATWAPWLPPIYASKAKDVAEPTTLDDRTRAQKAAAFHNNRLVAQATARANGSANW